MRLAKQTIAVIIQGAGVEVSRMFWAMVPSSEHPPLGDSGFLSGWSRPVGGSQPLPPPHPEEHASVLKGKETELEGTLKRPVVTSSLCTEEEQGPRTLASRSGPAPQPGRPASGGGRSEGPSGTAGPRRSAVLEMQMRAPGVWD